MKPLPFATLPFAALALLALGAASLRAEDVIVTSCVGATRNDCPPSCPDQVGTTTLGLSASSATPAGAPRSKTVFSITTNASWEVTPTLSTSSGAYRVYVTKGVADNCSPDLHVRITATSGCTLADTNYVAQATLDTTAFQQDASINVWTPVAVITNSSKSPKIAFAYAAGACSRWYMDAVRFKNILTITPTAARITNFHYGNPLTIMGTGPAGHPFALVSSTNPALPLNLWSGKQTNSTGRGDFSFSLTPDSARASFFRIQTQ